VTALVFLGTGWFGVVDAIAARLPEGASIRIRDARRPITAELADADVLIPSNARVGAAEMDAAPRCRLIQQVGVGYDGIDLAAARARGIPVCNTPDTNGASVGEAALLLLLAVARRLPEAQTAFRDNRQGHPVGRELFGRTLLVIGRGQTGGEMIRIARGIGMAVTVAHGGTTRIELEELIAGADFISLHCPLTERTRGMFDAAAFARMKPGAGLVNCARGVCVNRDALVHALESGQLGGYGADTHWREPWDLDDPIFTHPRVIALPHIGSTTEEALGRIADGVIDNVRRIRSGEAPCNRLEA
jgi:phosphoglycerate dehydrogenase-like enzyme